MSKPADQAAKAAPQRRRRSWRRFSLRSLMILVTLCCLGVGGKLQYDWYRKKWMVAEWVAPLVTLETAKSPTLITTFNRIDPPEGIKAKDEAGLLQFGVLELDTSIERFAALKILVESRNEESLPLVRDLIPRTRHPDMQAMLLHLVSLARQPDDVPRLEPFLQSPHAQVRGAAAESIGYIYGPFQEIPEGLTQWTEVDCLLHTNPPIYVGWAAKVLHLSDGVVGSSYQEHQDKLRRDKFPPGIRDRLENLMLHGETLEERTAASRALVMWPPEEYKLRLAEWGVWIDGPAKLEVAKSVMEEIPPFVHRTGNPNGSLTRNRFHGVIIITKPIVHLTADRPLAVDMEVSITSGRPWYAYPRPDGFLVHLAGLLDFSAPEMSAGELEAIDPQNLPILDPVSEGYPWLHPESRSPGAVTAGRHGRDDAMTAIGLHWQSLIVTPGREPWMALPEVPVVPGYAWWKSLRDVPSSWVTSQGETERFLYYDGPTLAKAPVKVQIHEGELRLKTQDLFRDRLRRREQWEDYSPPVDPASERDCLFIEQADGSPRGFRVSMSTALDRNETVIMASQVWRKGDDLAQALREILEHRGLSREEAEGLLASWREKFFQHSGKRLLTLLTPAEYDRMCPLEIRPQTTEQVRVGIVLTEF